MTTWRIGEAGFATEVRYAPPAGYELRRMPRVAGMYPGSLVRADGGLAASAGEVAGHVLWFEGGEAVVEIKRTREQA